MNMHHNYGIMRINVLKSIMWPWRKEMRKVWKLPNLIHCNLLPIITNCLPLNIILEKRLLKFIWSIINNENRIVNNVFKFSLNNRRSVLGKNFRYLAFKYKIKCSYWYTNLSHINSCFFRFCIKLILILIQYSAGPF